MYETFPRRRTFTKPFVKNHNIFVDFSLLRIVDFPIGETEVYDPIQAFNLEDLVNHLKVIRKRDINASSDEEIVRSWFISFQIQDWKVLEKCASKGEEDPGVYIHFVDMKELKDSVFSGEIPVSNAGLFKSLHSGSPRKEVSQKAQFLYELYSDGLAALTEDWE